MLALGLQTAFRRARMSAHSRREPNSLGRMGKPPLEITSSGGSRNPRLVALVRVLARQAARKAYFDTPKEHDEPGF